MLIRVPSPLADVVEIMLTKMDVEIYKVVTVNSIKICRSKTKAKVIQIIAIIAWIWILPIIKIVNKYSINGDA